MTDEDVIIALLHWVQTLCPTWWLKYGAAIVPLVTAVYWILVGIVWVAGKVADWTVNTWDNDAVRAVAKGLDRFGAFVDVARRCVPIRATFGPFPSKQPISTMMSRRPPPLQVPPPRGLTRSLPPIAAKLAPNPVPQFEPDPVPIAASSLPPAYYDRRTDPDPVTTRLRQDTPAESLAAKTKRLRGQ